MLQDVTLETLDSRVDAELLALPVDLQARFLRYGDLIREHGFGALPHGAARQLEGKLWELRLMGRTGIARTIYVTVMPKRVVVLRAFVKKSQKIPAGELEIARQRAKEVR